MQMQSEVDVSKQELIIEAEEVQKMKKAFAGIHVSPKRRDYYRVHFESGQALLTDGVRLHTIPVNYPTHIGTDVQFDLVQDAWRGERELVLIPDYHSNSFVQWRELVPKADLGILCDLDVWLPALASIRGWGWSEFAFHKHETVVRPVNAPQATMSLNLSHLMYKGKNLSEVERRVYNPQFIYDLLNNAYALEDSRVFLCLVSQNKQAPLLCRGNSSSFLGLVLSRK